MTGENYVRCPKCGSDTFTRKETRYTQTKVRHTEDGLEDQPDDEWTAEYTYTCSNCNRIVDVEKQQTGKIR